MKHDTQGCGLTSIAALLGAALLPMLPATFSAAAMAEEQAAPASTPQIEEIVITAQKRKELLKNTPVAASVVSEAALERSNASDISDLNNLVPSVELKGSFNGRVPLAMRGISTNANEAAIGLTSGVSILVDGVPIPSDSTSANELQDILRVEVLKGPQATLGGRTASAGVINFVTKVPSETFTGSVGATLTLDKEQKLNAYLSGPINDMFNYSLSAFDNRRDYPIVNQFDGQKSHSGTSGVRGKLLFKPTRDLDIMLTARSAESNSRGETFTYQYLTPGASILNLGVPGLGAPQLFPGIDIHYGNSDYNSPVTAMSSKSNDKDLGLNIDYRVGDYTISSTTAYQGETQNQIQDVPAVAFYWFNVLTGGSAPPFYDALYSNLKINSFSQELKIASPLDQPVSFVAGLFYSDVKVQNTYVIPWVANLQDTTTESINKTSDLYGRVTWNLAPATRLLTGLRYNHDEVGYNSVDRGNNVTGPTTVSASHAAVKENTVVGDLSLQQKLSDASMVYGTIARGYKPQAFNTAGILRSDDPKTAVQNEIINHIELGSKSTFFDRRLSLNTALFDTVYKGYQVQIYDTSSIIANLILANAGEARTRGLEADLGLAATTNTHFNLNTAFIDAKFLSYQGAACYPSQTLAQGCVTTGVKAVQDLSGKNMPDAPRFKMTLSAEHRIPAGMLPVDLTLNGQYAYRSAALLQADQNPQTNQPGFGILNLSLTAAPESGKYSVSLFVNNVTNRFYLVNAEDFFSAIFSSPGAAHADTNAVLGQPARDSERYVGLRFNLYF